MMRKTKLATRIASSYLSVGDQETLTVSKQLPLNAHSAVKFEDTAWALVGLSKDKPSLLLQ
ncbi:MAG: hypothetical protein ACREBW_06075 [Candidatus Micrarchaeaceae archaeon]